ncbi:MAG: hypothetical protein WCG83_03145 [Candidatus Peregrinibacteria bacterium]
MGQPEISTHIAPDGSKFTVVYQVIPVADGKKDHVYDEAERVQQLASRSTAGMAPGKQEEYDNPNATILNDEELQERELIKKKYEEGRKGFDPVKEGADVLREYLRAVSDEQTKVRKLSHAALLHLGLAERPELNVDGQPLGVQEFKTALTRMKPDERGVVISELAQMAKKKLKFLDTALVSAES